MDEVITRIMEVERQCAADIEQAEAQYAKRIEEHKRILEEKKTKEYARITAAENIRLAQAVEREKKQAEDATAVLQRDGENRLQDPVMKEAIKEDIISILLER